MKFSEVNNKKEIKETFDSLLYVYDTMMPVLVETALQHSTTIEDVIEVLEVAPPGKKAEKWIKDRKADFKERYGKDWSKVLYATAWKQFGESTDEQPIKVSEASNKTGLELSLELYPAELVSHFRDPETFSGFITDNRKVGRIAGKLLDGVEFKAGPIMRVAEEIKEYNRSNNVSVSNSKKGQQDARMDRLLRTRDSSNRATPRKFK
jgi:hypothetical protein